MGGEASLSKNFSGHLMLNVLIALGVSSFVFLALNSLIYNQFQARRMLKERLARHDFQLALTRSFSDGSLCTFLLTQSNAISFDSTNATPGNPNAPTVLLPLTTIPTSTAPSAPTLVVAGQAVSPVASTLVALSSNPFQLNSIVGTSAGKYGIFVANFQVKFDDRFTVQPLHPAQVSVILNTNSVGTTQTVSGCQNTTGLNKFDVPFATLTPFNTLCVGTFPISATEMLACTEACNRYCGGGCSTTLNNCSGPGLPGLGFSGGLITEWDQTNLIATCACTK
ncbi:MAG: hypothetical protein C5B49_11225 [Bdellovibrio sp.]|nr:MAG: hypothetical protein C5B49_11225 [Bdellovibrio sp.]